MSLSIEAVYSKNCPLCFDDFSSKTPRTRVLKAQPTCNWPMLASLSEKKMFCISVV